MIVAQERGIEFEAEEESFGDHGWYPRGGESNLTRLVWAAMEASLRFSPVDLNTWEAGHDKRYYGATLTKEGEAFRQRFVDYTPTEEETA